MKWSLPSFALRRPVTTVMLTFSLLILGLITWQRIDVEFTPAFDFPFVRCVIPYPGATPEQVVNEIAIPAEGQFRTISGIRSITSTADSDGCNVGMQFDWGTDMSVATAEVRDRMERLKLVLPSEVEQIVLRRFSSSSMPVLALGLYREGDDEEFAHLVRKVIEPQLMRIDGVANVMIFSRAERDVTIEFNQSALRSQGLGIYQVVSALQQSSLNVSVGELSEGANKYFVRVLGEFVDLDQIRDLVVTPAGLRLKDVAEVSLKARDPNFYYSIDGKTGVFLLVLKQSEANTVDTCRAAKAEIERLRQDPAFKGTDMFVFFNQADLIVSALDNLMNAGKYGGLLAFVVLFLFLRRLRPTLVVAFAIPSSLVVAVVVMYFSGMTLNVATMVSMIIGVGMLVDNSIVVVENIYRYNQLGYSPYDSAYRGASEVGMAITASTLTTAVVFIPVFYLQSGEMSVYMQQFAVPVITALVASLLIALTIIPLATSRMRPREELRIHKLWVQIVQGSGAGHALERTRLSRIHPLKSLINGYAWLLDSALKWRTAALAVVALLILATYLVPFGRVQQQRLPSLDTREVKINIKLDQNFDMDMAMGLFNQIEDTVDTQRDELGIKNIFVHAKPMGGNIDLYLLKPEDLSEGETFPYTTAQVRDILKRRLPEHLPGAEIVIDVAEAEEEKQGGEIAVRMRGDDPARLERYAEQFRNAVAQLPSVTEAKVDTERARQEIRLRINEERAGDIGVTPLVVARTVDFALRGSRLPYIKQGDREIPVWAQFREEDRKTKDNLENVSVVGATGDLVPLDQLVNFEKANSPSTITREGGKNIVTIQVKTASGDMRAARAGLERVIAAFNMPLGYSVDLGDALAELDVDLANTVTSLVMAILLIFIVMSALFESVLLPLSILTTVPLAFIGVFWTLYLTDTPMDTIGIIGGILMVGIVVNNGIVIVDHVNFLRGQGLGRHAAMIQAGRDRFRPVMMTALTTILGCVPLAIGGSTGNSVSFASLGRTLIGGLGVATLLTLLIVPVFYSLIDDTRLWAADFLASLTRGRAKAAARW